MVSDWRSSRSATAPTRRELTNRKALTRETKGKSSSTMARAKAVREPKCCNRASACFRETEDQPKMFCGVQRFRTIMLLPSGTI